IDVNLNAGTTGTLNLAISNNTWTLTNTGNGVDVNRAAGTLNLALSNNSAIRSSTASAVNITGGAVASTTISAFSGNTIAGATAGAGVTISNVTFDAVPGGAIDQVNGGPLAVGTAANPVGQGGLSVATSQGSLTFSDLDVFAGTGTALNLSGAGSGLTFGVT